jgi:nitrogen regulatory protein P-II 1
MKRIDAVIKPFKLDEVKNSITPLGSHGTDGFRGNVVEDLVEPVVKAIVDSARTDQIGDGKIVVTSLDDVIRIRTGERGQNAI